MKNRYGSLLYKNIFKIMCKNARSILRYRHQSYGLLTPNNWNILKVDKSHENLLYK